MNNSEPATSTFRIRSFRQPDSNACCAIFLSNVPKFFRAEELPEFQDYLQNFAEGSYWIVENDSREIVAGGGIHIKPNGDGSLCFGMVRADLHRNGIGSALLAFRAMELLKLDGLKRIRLDTSQHNPGFFGRFGFEEIAVQDNHYGIGLHRHDMQLDLSGCDTNAIKTSFKNLLQTSRVKV